jgi:hypothetical protein
VSALGGANLTVTGDSPFVESIKGPITERFLAYLYSTWPNAAWRPPSAVGED